MPEDTIRKVTYRRKFSPDLVKELSKRFKTRLTSIIYRLLALNIYPLFIVFINNGAAKYWSKSDGFWIKIKDITKLGPPEDSVAQEYIDAKYDFLYSSSDKAQQYISLRGLS